MQPLLRDGDDTSKWISLALGRLPAMYIADWCAYRGITAILVIAFKTAIREQMGKKPRIRQLYIDSSPVLTNSLGRAVHKLGLLTAIRLSPNASDLALSVH